VGDFASLKFIGAYNRARYFLKHIGFKVSFIIELNKYKVDTCVLIQYVVNHITGL